MLFLSILGTQDYFPSFLSASAYLLSCKDQRASMFGIHLYASLFEEFNDTYSRQEVSIFIYTDFPDSVKNYLDLDNVMEVDLHFTMKLLGERNYFICQKFSMMQPDDNFFLSYIYIYVHI